MYQKGIKTVQTVSRLCISFEISEYFHNLKWSKVNINSIIVMFNGRRDALPSHGTTQVAAIAYLFQFCSCSYFLFLSSSSYSFFSFFFLDFVSETEIPYKTTDQNHFLNINNCLSSTSEIIESSPKALTNDILPR